MAATLWDGLLMRGSTGETGEIPRSSSSKSPDLIAFGRTPMVNPSVLTEEDQYDNSFSNKIYLSAFNYLYMRGKNLKDGPISGHWEFWAVPSNLILLPGLWKNDPYTVRMQTSSGDTRPKFSAEHQNQIVASLDAFTWKVDPLPDNRHYCLIGVAVAEGHPNPIGDQGRISDWGAILAQNGNIAQRNTALVTGDVPDLTDSLPYNQGPEPAQVELAFVFNNMPLGSHFEVASGTPLPDGKTVTLEIKETTEFDFKKATAPLDIPENWSTNFNYNLKFGSNWGDITGTPSVTVRGEIPLASEHPFYRLGRIAGRDATTGAMRMDARGAPVRLLTVGTFSTIAVDKRNPNL